MAKNTKKANKTVVKKKLKEVKKKLKRRMLQGKLRYLLNNSKHF